MYRLGRVLIIVSLLFVPSSAAPASGNVCTGHTHDGNKTMFALPAVNDYPIPPTPTALGETVVPLVSAPVLHSFASSSKKLYLNFVGCPASQWGIYTNAYSPAYDTDGDGTTFSATELNNINLIWQRVSEDYAPFQVDVTTEVPAELGAKKGLEICIGGSWTLWYGSSAGGVAYLNSWMFPFGAPRVWAFEDNLGNGDPKFTAEAISHEAGHAFGLNHQSTYDGSCNKTAEYNPGSGSGETSWAPIMGVGYTYNRTTWHNGKPSNSCTISQLDLDGIALNGNETPYKTDDHGNTAGTASALSGSGTSFSGSGLISENTDVDMFSFAAGTGTVSIAVNGFEPGPNLDVSIRLLDGLQNVLAASDPAGLLDASVSTSVSQGTYYLEVKGNGVYGSIGQYTISGTRAAPPAPDTTAPNVTSTSLSTVSSGGGTQYSFTVQYSDNVAINVATLGSTDVSVAGPQSFAALAQFVSVNNGTNGTPRTATYAITPPGGSWDFLDNGNYTVSVTANQVSDTSGNPVPAGALNTFSVSISGGSDSDGDTIADSVDNCPADSNVAQTNADGDSQGDVCDTDDDNDTVADNVDCAPSNSAVYQNRAYPDGDNDGVPNSASLQTVACFGSLPPAGFTVLSSSLDNCPSVANADQTDSDTDGLGDACDTDQDGDGYADAFDCSPLDGTKFRIGAYLDSDRDGFADSTVPALIACYGTAAPAGFLGTLGTLDNCPTITNPTQADSNGNGLGDSCDVTGRTAVPVALDFDGDGVSDPLIRSGGAVDPLTTEYEFFLSASGTTPRFVFGSFFAVPAHGEYTGDAFADLGEVISDGNGLIWHIRDTAQQTDFYVPFGLKSDSALTGCDFNGDLITDLAVIRNGVLIYRDSTSGLAVFPGFTAASPLVWLPSITCADVNGDRRSELLILASPPPRKGAAVFTAKTAQVYVLAPNGGLMFAVSAANGTQTAALDTNGDGLLEPGFISGNGTKQTLKVYRLGTKKSVTIKLPSAISPSPAAAPGAAGGSPQTILSLNPFGQVLRFVVGGKAGIPLGTVSRAGTLQKPSNFGLVP